MNYAFRMRCSTGLSFVVISFFFRIAYTWQENRTVPVVFLPREDDDICCLWVLHIWIFATLHFAFICCLPGHICNCNFKQNGRGDGKSAGFTYEWVKWEWLTEKCRTLHFEEMNEKVGLVEYTTRFEIVIQNNRTTFECIKCTDMSIFTIEN